MEWFRREDDQKVSATGITHIFYSLVLTSYKHTDQYLSILYRVQPVVSRRATKYGRLLYCYYMLQIKSLW